MRSKKGQAGLAGALIGVLIATIIGVGVTIPVVLEVIANSSITGTTKTVVDLIPLMVGVVIFVGVASLVAFR
jgi:hypothetical protein